MKLFKTITVDPGLDGTGWAMWDGRDEPEYTGVVRLKPSEKSRYWLENSHLIATKFQAVLNLFRSLDTVYLEFPELWMESPKSMASAAKGDVFKLCYLTGYLGGLATLKGARVELLTPSKWKGQLPKNIVMERIEQAIGKTYKNHEADAVGMGLSVMKIL